MSKTTHNSAVFGLCLTSTILWTSGNGLIPLLPVYAGSLGASNFHIGLYLAFSYSCLAVGALLATKIIDHASQAKTLLVTSGLMSVPLTFMVGQANSVVELACYTSIVWLLGGAGFGALNALTGHITQAHDQRVNNQGLNHQSINDRGKVMGVLAITSPLGSVLGGLISGPIVDQWGFEALFLALALLNLLWPVSSLFIPVANKYSAAAQPTNKGSKDSVPSISEPEDKKSVVSKIRRLIGATTLMYVTYYIGLFATSITMKDVGFSATAISSTAIWGGLAAIPFVYGITRISDWLGRKPFWMLCNLAGFAGLMLLAYATTLFHFWLVAVLIRFLSSGGRGLSNAWTMDVISAPSISGFSNSNPSHAISSHTRASGTRNSQLTSPTEQDPKPLSEAKVMALLSYTTWIGGVLGYLIYGSSAQMLNTQSAVLITSLIPFIAMFLVLSINHSPNLTQRGNL